MTVAYSLLNTAKLGTMPRNGLLNVRTRAETRLEDWRRLIPWPALHQAVERVIAQVDDELARREGQDSARLRR